MNLRLSLLALLAFLSSTSVLAQDTIYTTQGTKINARVTSRSVFSVGYEDSDSTHQRIRADRVVRVAYSDGSTWAPRSENAQKQYEHRTAHSYRPANVHKGYANACTVNFPTYFDIDHYPGIAIGLGYERFWGVKGHFSTSLSMEKAWAGTNAHGEMRTGEVRANIQSFYFRPGFFYHPAGNSGDVDLAVGASFPLGNIQWRYDQYDWTQPKGYPPPSDDFLAAALGEINLTIHGPNLFIFTTTLAAGPVIINGEMKGALVLFGIKMGGRF
jgi:hypothetical protein